jgi:hypothetical protein
MRDHEGHEKTGEDKTYDQDLEKDRYEIRA